MPIKERLQQLQNTREEEKARLEAARKEVEAKKSKRYWEETLADAKKQQAALLEELREIGIVKMIEEFIDQSIPPMVVEDFGQQTITKEGFRQFQAKLDPQEIRRRLDKWAAREWEVDILLPVMSETGAADPTLVIQLNKLDKWPLSPADRDKPIAKVRVSYGVNRQLEIKGEEVIFKGTIPSDGQERLEIIETALTKAIDQPEPLPRPRIYRNLGHNIPIRAGA